MKKLLFIISLITVFSQSFSVVAFAAASPTPTPNQAITAQIEQQINNLKDKIASKVAQLKLVEKRGLIGTVTDVNNTQITISDENGNVHFIDVDELTTFSSPAKSSNFGISDITKNSTIGVLGLYNKESRRILARFVNVLTLPQVIHGAIAAIDRTNYTLTIVQNDGKQIVVEIEDVTKSSAYIDNATGLTKSGFSKTIVGERIYVVGYPDKQNAGQIIASRIIIFPNLPINPAINNALPALSASPSTPSATPSK